MDLTVKELKECELQAIRTHITALKSLKTKHIINDGNPDLINGIEERINQHERWKEECECIVNEL